MAPSQSPCQAIYSSSITWCLFLSHVPVMLRQPLDLHWLQKSASISYLKDSTYHALDIWSKSALWPVNPHSPSHNLPLPPGAILSMFSVLCPLITWVFCLKHPALFPESGANTPPPRSLPWSPKRPFLWASIHPWVGHPGGTCCSCVHRPCSYLCS